MISYRPRIGTLVCSTAVGLALSGCVPPQPYHPANTQPVRLNAATVTRMTFVKLDEDSDRSVPIVVKDRKIIADFVESLTTPPTDDPADSLVQSYLVIRSEDPKTRAANDRTVAFNPIAPAARYGGGFPAALAELSVYQTKRVRSWAAAAPEKVASIVLVAASGAKRTLRAQRDIAAVLSALRQAGPASLDYMHDHNWLLVKIAEKNGTVLCFLIVPEADPHLRVLAQYADQIKQLPANQSDETP